MKTTSNASDVLFELSFRTTVGATIRIANAYLVNDAEVFFAPTNRANIYKNNIKGLAVNGNSFDQGVRINGALQNQIAPAVTTASEYLLEKGNYPVYIVSGGWTGNLFLADANYNGQRIVIKRDGVAATGVMQLLPVGTIDGSGAAISIATIYTYLELIYSTVAGGWLRIN
jgi:alkyl hydroperoxide reductase subunit AhpF